MTPTDLPPTWAQNFALVVQLFVGVLFISLGLVDVVSALTKLRR